MYQAKHVTLYMHALIAMPLNSCHFIKTYAYYTQLGLENYKDGTFQDFFTSTNHKWINALKQLFLKQKTWLGSWKQLVVKGLKPLINSVIIQNKAAG